MTKSKRHINTFINHLFTLYHVPRIPVYIHWHHSSLVDDQGNYGFGALYFGNPAHPCIHIAGKVLGKTDIMRVFAHEFGHYLQYHYGQELNEEGAEKYASVIMRACAFNKRKLVVIKHRKFVKVRKMFMSFPVYVHENRIIAVTPPLPNESKEETEVWNPTMVRPKIS